MPFNDISVSLLSNITDTCGPSEILLTLYSQIHLVTLEPSPDLWYHGLFGDGIDTIQRGERLAKGLSCVWLLKGPNGTSFQIELISFDADDMILIILNGHELVNATKALVVHSGDYPNGKVFVDSIYSTMTIVVKSKTASSTLREFLLRVTATDIKGRILYRHCFIFCM